MPKKMLLVRKLVKINLIRLKAICAHPKTNHYTSWALDSWTVDSVKTDPTFLGSL